MAEVGATAELRRMLFATSFLPPALPCYWELIAKFASQDKPSEIASTPEFVKIAMENMEVLNSEAFISDTALTDQLINMEYIVTKQPLGIPLISKLTECQSCGGTLSLRSDRPSRLTIYTLSLGTVSATHFHKHCQNYHKGCKFVQYYGYYKHPGSGRLVYDNNWNTLPYFISSQETGFEMRILQQYDTELLLGQMSYHQKAEIYNTINGYDTTKKMCSTIEPLDRTRAATVHG